MPVKADIGALNCSLAHALASVGDWWTLLIVRDLFLGMTRFSDMQKSLGIARNILATRLTALIERGIVTRKGSDRRPRYELTRKGRELLPALVALLQWGDKWASPEGAPMIVTDVAGRKAASVGVSTAAGTPITAATVRFRAGPGAEPRTRTYLAMLARKLDAPTPPPGSSPRARGARAHGASRSRS